MLYFITNFTSKWLRRRPWMSLVLAFFYFFYFIFCFIDFYISFQSIFLASGPSFQFNMTIEPFENIELYNLLTGKASIILT